MAIDLPDFEQQWTADVAPYVAALADAIAMSEELAGGGRPTATGGCCGSTTSSTGY